MLIALGVVAVLVLLILFWGIGTYNRFVGLRTRVEEAFSTIDVFLKKRYDLIPNLVETVKGYAGHEKGTLEAVISARSNAMSGTPEQRIEAEGQLTQALGRLMVLTESYPELKANTNFTQLQTQLSDLESEIERARRYYNGMAAEINMAVKKFPANVIAGMFGFQPVTYFEAEAEHRENVKVQF